jgi:ATP-dependent Lon protease
MTVLPGMMIHFDVSREKSIKAVEKAMLGDRRVFLATQRTLDEGEPQFDELYQIGTLALVKQLVKLPQGIIRVMVEGISRGELLTLEGDAPYLVGEVLESDFYEDIVNSNPLGPATQEAMLRLLRDKLEEYGAEYPQLEHSVLPNLFMLTDLHEFMEQLVIQLPWSYQVRQEYLEEIQMSGRFEKLLGFLSQEVEVSKIRQEFARKVKAGIDKNQKEYIMREQMKIIRSELGEEGPLEESEEFEERLRALKADTPTKEKIRKEIGRYRMMPQNSPELPMLRNYIETVLELPWKKVSKDSKDLDRAQAILNEDHYGLAALKERVLEYLAVRALTPKSYGPILCLVGPPGTGKTSVAKSVARALDKKYVRISLGGVRDEAEIRGHRRTYIGAMPGRFAEALRHAGVANPLMLLDEIDKVSSDYKGDTASALLEVLDGEQNVKFRDHYVEAPIDLSQVLFIATANTTATIPAPLLDRMEVIEVNSYTKNEKFHIAKDFLVDKQLERNGLNPSVLRFTDDALHDMIHYYTREAGVRMLERRIGEVCRKVAREYLKGKRKRFSVSAKNLAAYLGKRKYDFEEAGESAGVGIVRGLAWTQTGGDTLQIEVNTMPGKGEQRLTGQMGDVMKESARIALTYIRSLAPTYKVSDQYFAKHDIHIHIPQGAVPKDGPSAGIAMATAMLSAVTQIPVSASVAMTGEITLRGRVLPVGGLKEKILAAKMANIKKVLVPEKNRPDVEELSEEITGGLDIVYVGGMEAVLGEALEPEP